MATYKYYGNDSKRFGNELKACVDGINKAVVKDPFIEHKGLRSHANALVKLLDDLDAERTAYLTEYLAKQAKEKAGLATGSKPQSEAVTMLANIGL